jgi:hypothetical protein
LETDQKTSRLKYAMKHQDFDVDSLMRSIALFVGWRRFWHFLAKVLSLGGSKRKILLPSKACTGPATTRGERHKLAGLENGGLRSKYPANFSSKKSRRKP